MACWLLVVGAAGAMAGCGDGSGGSDGATGSPDASSDGAMGPEGGADGVLELGEDDLEEIDD